MLDLLKLSVMQALVATGGRVEVAAEAPALVETVLSREDKAALDQRKVPLRHLMFIRVGEALEVAHYLSLSGAKAPFDSADEALTASPTCAVFWWTGPQSSGVCSKNSKK